MNSLIKRRAGCCSSLCSTISTIFSGTPEHFEWDPSDTIARLHAYQRVIRAEIPQHSSLSTIREQLSALALDAPDNPHQAEADILKSLPGYIFQGLFRAEQTRTLSIKNAHTPVTLIGVVHGQDNQSEYAKTLSRAINQTLQVREGKIFFEEGLKEFLSLSVGNNVDHHYKSTILSRTYPTLSKEDDAYAIALQPGQSRFRFNADSHEYNITNTPSFALTGLGCGQLGNSFVIFKPDTVLMLCDSLLLACHVIKNAANHPQTPMTLVCGADHVNSIMTYLKHPTLIARDLATLTNQQPDQDILTLDQLLPIIHKPLK